MSCYRHDSCQDVKCYVWAPLETSRYLKRGHFLNLVEHAFDVVGLVYLVNPHEACITEGRKYYLFVYPSSSTGRETPFLGYVISAHVQEFGGCVAFIFDVSCQA